MTESIWLYSKCSQLINEINCLINHSALDQSQCLFTEACEQKYSSLPQKTLLLNASLGVPPLIVWLCDITASPWHTLVYFCPAACLAIRVDVAQACVSWPIKADLCLKETGAEGAAGWAEGSLHLVTSGYVSLHLVTFGYVSDWIWDVRDADY